MSRLPHYKKGVQDRLDPPIGSDPVTIIGNPFQMAQIGVDLGRSRVGREFRGSGSSIWQKWKGNEA